MNFFEKRALYLINPYLFLDAIPSSVERVEFELVNVPNIIDLFIFPIGIYFLHRNNRIRIEKPKDPHKKGDDDNRIKKRV